MYLKKIVCENMGPISYVDIEPGFNADTSPKPLILVGKNGTGKSILISNIVDSFFEFGDQAYSDMTHKVNLGHSYFKISSRSQIQIGKDKMCCFLKYSTENTEETTAEYLYHVGDFDISNFSKNIADRYKPLSYNKDAEKNFTKNAKLFEKEFGDNVIVYFPPERFSIPYWMGAAYSSSHEYGDIMVDDKFKNVLNKPIIADDTTKENTKWLIDVIVDSKAELIRSNGNYQIPNPVNYELLRKSRENVEAVVSEIIEDTVLLELGWRNSGKSRLIINSVMGKKTIAPTIDALSTGQMVLLNMFLTIVRYADSTDINRSIQLQNIAGIVVIDEIELHLHADLQRKVLPKLIKLFPRVQFIITSHSPLFLLGMREVFHDDGFDIYEMPDGKKIDAEDFSEFEHAYNAMMETRTFRIDVREKIQKAIVEQASKNKSALIITEGPSDWKHMMHAWNRLKTYPEYDGLDGKFEFLEYYPANHASSEIPEEKKFSMGDSELVKTCEGTAKLPQQRKVIFIADADQPEKTKKLVDHDRQYKDWGNQVYSFQIPIPQHRNGRKVCIEHYYTDEELKTEKEINGKKCRLFLGNEFDVRGISLDHKYFCSNKNECGPDKNSIIEGDAKARVSLITDQNMTVALPKTDFADAILNDEGDFSKINCDNFKLIFDILLKIIKPDSPNINDAENSPIIANTRKSE